MVSIITLTHNMALSGELEIYLHRAGYRTIALRQPTNDFTSLARGEIIVLDATTIENDYDFLLQFQTHSRFIPVIALIEQGDVKKAVQLLRAGAIDALELPVSEAALLKSVEHAIAYRFSPEQNMIQQAIDLLQSIRVRYGQPRSIVDTQTVPAVFAYPNIIQIGELVINIDQVKVFYQRKPVDLTPTQFRLLAYLGQARGRVVPFEELYDHLHGVQLERSVARTALSAHLSNLRANLSEVGCRDYLENIRGRGYLLDAPEQLHERDTDSVN